MARDLEVDRAEDSGEAPLRLDDAFKKTRPTGWGKVGDALLLLDRDDQGVAWPARVDVEEGVPGLALGDLARGDGALDDFREEALLEQHANGRAGVLRQRS